MLDNFHYNMDPVDEPRIYRNRESINSKWKTMGRECTRFYNIINQIKHASGGDGVDLISTAQAQYVAEYHAEFTYMGCFNICRDHPKWKTVMQKNKWTAESVARGVSSQSSGSKRTRTDDELYPGGRDKNRERARAAKASKTRAGRGTTSVEINQERPDYVKIQEMQMRKLELETKKLAMQEKREKRRLIEKQKEECHKILGYNAEAYDPIAREKILKLQIRAIEKLEKLEAKDYDEAEDEEENVIEPGGEDGTEAYDDDDDDYE